jgi:hypothetical protein
MRCGRCKREEGGEVLKVFKYRGTHAKQLLHRAFYYVGFRICELVANAVCTWGVWPLPPYMPYATVVSHIHDNKAFYLYP